MRLGRRNVADGPYEELADVVDSMPFNSSWAPGQLAGCEMGDVNAGAQVSTSGVQVSGGINWTTVALIAGGFWLFGKMFKKG